MTTVPGTDVLLGERYRLVSIIAAGGMGEVWSATDEVLGRNVAVKVLRREYAEDPAFRQRFRAEARHTAALSHPGIAAVYDYYDGSSTGGDEGRAAFLVMENVPGEPLSALLARVGAVPCDRTLDVIGQAALALQAAHDGGVIHRDVKPGNILLRPDGAVKITDFGISRAVNSAPLTATGDVMGTAFYLSPEQASGQSVTAASDVYSLGVVAYECLTGRRPFAGESPVSVALAHVRDEPPALGDVRPEVSALVLRMLAKSPADRPASAGELAREALDLRSTLSRSVAATRTMPATEPITTDLAATEVLATGPALPRGSGRRDGHTDPRFRLPLAGRTPRWVPYAAGLLACALVLIVVAHVRADGEGSTDASDPKTSPTGPASLLVRAPDYVGKPVAEASAALRALGLAVSLRPVPAGPGTPIGTVTGVTPVGRLNADDRVTLEFASAPTGPVAKKPKQDKTHNGPSKQEKKNDRKQGKP